MRILLVSPTSWGTLRLSKHHYARELACRGHDVTFLNPPNRRLSNKVEIAFDDGARIVTFRPPFPMRTRRLAPRLYGRLMSRLVHELSVMLGGRWDLLWCF